MIRYQPHLVMPVGPRDHLRGPDTAPLTLLEYGDFECPYCGAAHPVVLAVRRSLGKLLRTAFRHFPLHNVHPHAQLAAEAAEAAGSQAKFWEMHDQLFENQHALDAGSLVAHARKIGLDLKQFSHELNAGTHTARVREDFLSGVRSGVNGTPAFYINGVRYDGPADVASMVMALEEALQAT